MSRRALRSALCLLTLVGALTLVTAEPQARPFCLPSPDCDLLGGFCASSSEGGCVCFVPDGSIANC